MPILKFGQHLKFGEDKFGAKDKGRAFYQRTYRGRYLGDSVHKKIGVYSVAGTKYYDKAVIFWVIHGIQHKAPYLFLYPGGPPSSGAGGDKLKAARVIYKTFSAEQKAAYDEQAAAESLPLGFNIYLREYNEANP